MLTIRQATRDDFATIAQVNNLATPHHLISSDTLLYAETRRDPRCREATWVVITNDQIVGFGGYIQYADEYDPQRFYLRLKVHPEFQKRGFGRALYDTVLAAVREFDPVELKVSIRADYPDALRFAQQRGFKEFSRRLTSRLDLHTVIPDSLLARIRAVEGQGITFKSIEEICDEPEYDARLNELKWSVEQDVPFPGTLTPLTLDQFRQQVLLHPEFEPNVSKVAVDGDRYIGLTLVYGGPSLSLDVDISGTLAAYRRRGIATALKLHSILAAQARGYHIMRTTNDLDNPGILAINKQIGFQPEPADVRLHLLVGELS